MQRIAANQSNFGVSQSIGATTGAKAETDLRGLGGPTGANGNKTLVLLNGRRIVNHSFDAAAVDLNAIPLNAIDRIEVLRDGASAIYGTDAIGGVINFHPEARLPGLRDERPDAAAAACRRWPDRAGQRHPRLGLAGDERLQLHGLVRLPQPARAGSGAARLLEERRHPVAQWFPAPAAPASRRPERFRAVTAELQSAGVDSEPGRHLLPLRLLARRRHHSAEPAGHAPWSRAASRSRRITSARSSTCSRRTSRPRALPRRRPAT